MMGSCLPLQPAIRFQTISRCPTPICCSNAVWRRFGPRDRVGQHRNKTDSGVRLRHDPSGVTAQAVERRSQHQNRTEALHRLREAIAVQVRRLVDLEAYTPPPELAAILPGATSRIGSKQDDYWRGAQALLDLLAATDGAVSGCSGSDWAQYGAAQPPDHRGPAIAAGGERDAQRAWAETAALIGRVVDRGIVQRCEAGPCRRVAAAHGGLHRGGPSQCPSTRPRGRASATG